MKQQVRVGVLASLLMAPAVLASANEQVNQENINPEQAVEQAEVVHPLAVNPTSDAVTAAPQNENETSANAEINQEHTQEVTNAVASPAPTAVAAPVAQVSNVGGAVVASLTDIEIKRVAELKGLGEKTLSYDFTKYNTWIGELQTAGVLQPNEAAFLTAKVTYLKDFEALRTKAKLINDEIKLLKATNSNVIERVEALVAELAPIEGDFKTIRDTFDAVYKTYYNIKVTSFRNFLSPNHCFSCFISIFII